MSIVKKYQAFYEAFLSKDKEKAIDLIISNLTNKTGIDLYPYDELFHIQKENLFLIGQLFLSLNTNKAVRINWIKDDLRSEINSIDVWDSFSFDTKPEYTLYLEGLSITKYLSQIADFFKTPSKYISDEVPEESMVENYDPQSELEEQEKKLKRARSADSKERIKRRIDQLTGFIAKGENVEKDSDKITQDDLRLDVFKAIELYTIQVAKGKSNSLIITGLAGVGKCHGRGTKVLMYDGSVKNVENINIGDVLMGDDSSPRRVTRLGSGKDTMYRIKGRKGFEEFTCNSDHILSLIHTTSKKIVNISIKEYLLLSDSKKIQLKLYKRKIEFIETPVKIDPYLLGIWLGDGRKDYLHIETMDTEIIDYLYQVANTWNLKLRKIPNTKSKSDGYALTVGNISGHGINKNPLINAFKEYGLLNGTKFIPKDFMENSRENRLKLLAGLVDTDGYLFNKTYSICTKYLELAEQIKFLCRSLGFNSHIYKKTIRNIGKDKKTGTYYNINISGDISIVPVLLDRKRSGERMQKKNILVSGFEIEEIGIDNYYGFEIDGNNLYMLGDFTITHNTATVTDTLKSIGMIADVHYYKSTGTATTAALYEILFKHRNKLVIFDDCDSVFKEPDSINMLKGALDTYDVREISKHTKGNTFDSTSMSDLEIQTKWEQNERLLPNRFEFKGRVIFISNLPEEKFDDALISRSLHVDVHLNKQEIISRMKDIMSKMLPDISIDKKEEALEYLTYITDNYPVKFDLNIRTLIHSINLRAGNEELMTIAGREEFVWKLLVKKYLIKTKK